MNHWKQTVSLPTFMGFHVYVNRPDLMDGSGEKRSKETLLPHFFRTLLQNKIKTRVTNWVVVSTHLKNISQIGSFFQVGVKIKNV